MILIGKLLLILVGGQWLVGQADSGHRQFYAAQSVRDYGGFAFHESHFVGDARNPGRRPWAPAWVRRTIGDDFFQDVVEVNLVYGSGPNGERVEVVRTDDDVIPGLLAIPGLKRLYIHKGQATDRAMETVAKLADLEVLMMWDAQVTDAGIAKLKGLKKLRNIHVSNAGLGDDGLKHLSRLPRLEIMSLQGNRFTDEGLAHLKGMTNLKSFIPDLGETVITDDGLAHLKGLSKLERLGLQKTQVTDAGLEHLKGLRSLKEIWVSQTQITAEGTDRLKVALPNLKVVQ